MTKTLRLTNDDLNELLSILNVALYDMDIAINESHDLEEVAALREHKAIIRQWIHRLSQMDDGDESPTEHTVRVHFIDGTERIVPAKDFHWHEEGARSATALVDGREIPIYKRSEPEWGSLWYEQAALHYGTCVECERLAMLNGAGVCEGCVMQAMIDESERGK